MQDERARPPRREQSRVDDQAPASEGAPLPTPRWKHLWNENIVCFSTADWDTPLPTNKHQLMARLARRNRVLYIETLGTRGPDLSNGVDAARIGRRLKRGAAGMVRREKRLWSLAPLVRPAWGRPTERALNRVAFRAQASRALAKFPDAIAWVYSPYAVHLLDIVQPRGIVYHMVDDLAEVPGADAEAIREAERQLLARADCVFCTERSLYDRAAQVNPGARFLPNVADYRHFSRPGTVADARLNDLLALPRPIVVFSGNIAPHKVDLKLLGDLAEARPQWSFAIVGPVWEGARRHPQLERLGRIPNAHLMGHVDYRDLPAFLHAADALVIPYIKSKATQAVFPLKFFEYLGTGKPVVASPLPSLLPYKGAVEFGGSRARWLKAIQSALDDPERLRTQRLALARRHTWAVRLREMEREIVAAMGRGGGEPDDPSAGREPTADPSA